VEPVEEGMASGVGRFTGPFLLLGLLVTGGCYDFNLAGPEDPDPLPAPRLVSVTIEYRQPQACFNVASHCDDLVVFFGSWMRPGAEFFLQADPGSHVWTGVAHGVPVNFPPTGGEPYSVRVFDPRLRGLLTEGFSAERLEIGGQIVLRIDRPGGKNEAGLIYIDENGLGRNPY
jgi:hypothetical protein